MTDRRKQLRVGIFALATASLVALVLIVFGGMRFWKHYDHYTVELDDSVMGLQEGAQVFMNGIKVGTVDDIQLAPDDLRRVRIEVEVERGTPVHADTHAFLSMAGITGLKVIDLKGGSLTAPLVAPGGAIAAGEGTLDKLEKKAEMLADETDHLMKRANEIVDGANRVMANLTAATDPKTLQAILASTHAAATNLADASRGIKAMVEENRASMKESLDSVATVAKSASTLMTTQVAGFVGNANDLVSDLRGVIHSNETTLQSAMADIRQASRSFKDLAREVREKPSRLLFSAAAPERKLP